MTIQRGLTEEAFLMQTFLRIANKDKEDVDFILNDAQAKLDSELTGRDIIPKARQEGISSYFLGRFTIACIHKRNTNAVIISHEQLATERLLKRCTYFIKNFKGAKIKTENMSAHEITFPKTNSMLYIGTAGSKKFGRGDMITNLHCSEVAYWANSKELLNGLLDAVPTNSGEIAFESTGNGMNDYYKRCMRAATGTDEYALHFFGWDTFHEYRFDLTKEEEAQFITSLPKDLNNDPYEELKLYRMGLTAGQLAWRRTKLAAKDYDLKSFKQEYPLSLDECFQASGGSIFYKVLYTPTKDWEQVDTNFSILKSHPIEGHIYVIGVDTAAGVEKDRSVMEIIDVELQEQVGEWVSDKTSPDILGEKVFDMANMFNEAYIVVESNNHGPITLSYLRDNYPNWKLYSQKNSGGNVLDDKSLMRLGLKTTVRSKPIIIGKLRMALSKTLTTHSPLLQIELSTFIEHPDGKLAADNNCFDDRVMALGMANMGLLEAIKVMLPAPPRLIAYGEPTPDPFLFENILAGIKNRKGKFPIAPQHRGA